MRRYLTAFILALIATALLAFVYLTSPRRDAEVALGLKSLPWSARNLLVSADAWTDYVVRGYIEVTPEDFESIVSARAFDRMDHSEHALSEKPLPAGRLLTSTRSYYWNKGVSHCKIECDATRSWIWFLYSTD
jgi:hypothetical protein